VGGPGPRGRLDHRSIQRRPAGQIEIARDHHEFAAHRLEREPRVPEVVQMPEELSSFVGEWARAVTRERDRTGKEFFKHGRTPFLGIRPFSATGYVVFIRTDPPRGSTNSAVITT